MKKHVVITLATSEFGEIDSIVEQLSNEGLHVSRVNSFGVIRGIIDDQYIDHIRQHQDILSIAEEKHYNINPPDFDVQ